MDGPDQAAAAANTAHNALEPSDQVKNQCRIDVLELFPDVDPAHMDALCLQQGWHSGSIIQHILDELEEGRPYPKPPRANLKRKRADDQPAAITPASAAKKWDNEERRSQFKDPRSTYTRTSHQCLAQFFPQLYVDNLKGAMALHGGILYPTYLFLSQALASGQDNPHTARKKAKAPKGLPALAAGLEQRIQNCKDDGEREALEELRDARAVVEIQTANADEQRREELEEEANLEAARLDGTITDCGCCYVECAINRMVHCNGEEVHFFCRTCARTNAETQIGMAKYQLDCMSSDGDGCPGSFSHSQRLIFLDPKLQIALEQIEMDASIRASGIENIETCPFCSYAAEYPDLEVDREFRCLRDDCGIVSCRACRKETHIPKTCAEFALEQGHSARHGIEEAMSEALIRKCNKCSTPFIKELGCNKMTCTKCSNIQCYVCSKSCDYSHFNDTRRGGRTGNCELFDNPEGGVEARHRKEVSAAEEAARKKAQEEFKDVDPEFLEFKESEKVKNDQAQLNKGQARGVDPLGIHVDAVAAARINHLREAIRHARPGRAVRRGVAHLHHRLAGDNRGVPMLREQQPGAALHDLPVPGPVPDLDRLLDAPYGVLVPGAFEPAFEAVFHEAQLRLDQPNLGDPGDLAQRAAARNAVGPGRAQHAADFNQAVNEHRMQIENDHRARQLRQQQQQQQMQQEQRQLQHRVDQLQQRMQQQLLQRQQRLQEQEQQRQQRFDVNFQRELDRQLGLELAPAVRPEALQRMPEARLQPPGPVLEPQQNREHRRHPLDANHRQNLVNDWGLQGDNLFGGLVEAAANQEYAIPGAAVPNFRPGNLLLDPLNSPVLPAPRQMRERAPPAVPDQGHRAQAHQQGANHELPRPATPPLEQRGGRDDPISLVSPAAKADMIDLTGDDNNVHERRFYDEPWAWALGREVDADYDIDAWDM